jgi:uncharacterized membrane protein YfcA
MMIDSWLSFPVGILIATIVSTVGIGGGILWMPFLLILLKLQPDKAVFTSLLIQTAGMGSGAFAYWQKKQIDYQLMLLLLGVALPGIAVGAFLTRILSPQHLEFILGSITLATALIFVSANQRYGDSGRDRAELRVARRYGPGISAMAVASGMLSISIGEWLVPLMRSKLSLRMNIAVATSVATIFGTCVMGATAHFCMGGQVDGASLAWAVPGVIIGGQIGPRIAERINDRILKEIFIFLLTLIGIHLIYNSY